MKQIDSQLVVGKFKLFHFMMDGLGGIFMGKLG